MNNHLNLLNKPYVYSKDEMWSTRTTSIHPKGHCQACKMKLKPLEIAPDEFNKLREQIMAKVMWRLQRLLCVCNQNQLIIKIFPLSEVHLYEGGVF